MGTRTLAVLLLAPSAALAQFGTVTPSEIPRADVVIGSSTTPGCTNVSQSVTITFTINTAGGDRYDVYAQTGSCSATQTPSATPVATSTAVDPTTLRSVTTSPSVIANRLGITDCNQAADVTYYLCAYLMSSSTIVATAFSDGSSKFQLAIPPKPSISVSPANEALDVTVTPGTANSTYQATSSIRYEATATPVGGGTAVSSGRGGVSDTTLRISGLANLQYYDVVAIAYSSALNPGPPSDPVLNQQPLPFGSFWDNYQGAGGREQGGCGGGAGALSLLALLPLALRRRRP